MANNFEGVMPTIEAARAKAETPAFYVDLRGATAQVVDPAVEERKAARYRSEDIRQRMAIMYRGFKGFPFAIDIDEVHRRTNTISK